MIDIDLPLFDAPWCEDYTCRSWDCYSEADRCDGVAICVDATDEIGCFDPYSEEEVVSFKNNTMYQIFGSFEMCKVKFIDVCLLHNKRCHKPKPNISLLHLR